MAQITLSSNVVVPNGPSLAFQQTLDVEAYDLIEVTVPLNTTDKAVELPASTGGVQFVSITSDWFGDDLSYTINGDSQTTAVVRRLDQPHVLAGKGAISLFEDQVSAGAPSKLFFTNAATGPNASDAHVKILIGRDATP